MSKRVLVGMSGGVDSSVSAFILKEQGYEVVGVTMLLWEEDKKIKTVTQNNEKKYIETNAINDAKNVCEQFGIEHHVVDLKSEFNEKVIKNFICSYMCAKTPNPCIECNKFMKFGAFFKIAQDLNCDYIATGHYAKIEYSNKYKNYVLKKSEAQGKDQTYFLYGINKEILSKIIFPLANFKNKDEIRKIAIENDLKVAEKKDSQEICFISENYVDFLKNSYEENKDLNKKNKSNMFKKGNIVLKDGTIVGQHSGLVNYTIGQRRGLGITNRETLYVVKMNPEKNEIVVGTTKDLYTTNLVAGELNFLLDIDLSKEINVKAKIRYRTKEAEAKLNVDIQNNLAKLTFLEPQRAITPGQSVVFYIDDIVLGGGKIL